MQIITSNKDPNCPWNIYEYLFNDVNTNPEILKYCTISGSIDTIYDSWLSRTNSLPSTYELNNFVVYRSEISMVEIIDDSFSLPLHNHVQLLYQVVQNRTKLEHWELIETILEKSPYRALLVAEEKVQRKDIDKFLFQIESCVFEQYVKCGMVRIPYRPTQCCSETGILEYPVYQQALRPVQEPFESKYYDEAAYDDLERVFD